jgi:hypothetical protein
MEDTGHLGRGTAIVVACSDETSLSRLRMLSTSLEAAGYGVTVLAGRDVLGAHPRHVGWTEIVGVPVTRMAHATAPPPPDPATSQAWVRLASLERELMAARGRAGGSTVATRPALARTPASGGHVRTSLRRVPPELIEVEVAFGPRLDRLRAGLLVACDVEALLVCTRAARRWRWEGGRVLLAYDRTRAPGGWWARRERRAMRDVDLGLVGDEVLDDPALWPSHLSGQVPVVAQVPLDLPLSAAVAKPLRLAVKGRRGVRIGVFLPRSLSRSDTAELSKLLATSAGGLFILLGRSDQHRELLAGVPAERMSQIIALALPDPDLLPQYVAHLGVVVCPSVWDRRRAASEIATAAQTVGKPLIASAESRPPAGDVRTARGSAQLRAALDEILTRGDRAPAAPRPRSRYAEQVRSFQDAFGSAPTRRLGIGPRNGNGQAWAWAQALRVAAPTLPVEAFAAAFATGRLDMRFVADMGIPIADWKRQSWQLWWAHRLRNHYSHLLIEQGLTACGWLNGKRFYHDLDMLRRADIEVGLVFRGSDIRDPAGHAAREPFSPYRDPADPLTERLQTYVGHQRRHLDEFEGPVFVTTLDLLDDVPRATWLPQVLDVGRWHPGAPVLERARPIVLHAPSKEQVKGSAWVDAACRPLHDAGLIEYRRLSGVPFSQMPEMIGSADIVIDQMALGAYGVLALQALASERLVIGHVSERVRARLAVDLPILQADPPQLRQVLEQVLADRASAAAIAARGREYVTTFHSGAHSAQALLEKFVGPPADAGSPAVKTEALA